MVVAESGPLGDYASGMSGMLLRVVAWAVWQLIVLGFAFLAWVNLFSEYGVYPSPVVGSIAGLMFLGIALFVGTWVPVRRWRAERQD
jgi:hypothetical protein